MRYGRPGIAALHLFKERPLVFDRRHPAAAEIPIRAARFYGKAVPHVIVRADSEAPFGQKVCKMVIASDVLGNAVDDLHHRARRSLRRPERAVNAARAVRGQIKFLHKIAPFGNESKLSYMLSAMIALITKGGTHYADRPCDFIIPAAGVSNQTVPASIAKNHPRISDGAAIIDLTVTAAIGVGVLVCFGLVFTML